VAGADPGLFDFLRRGPAKWMTAALLLHIVAFHSLPEIKDVVQERPLNALPGSFRGWNMTQEAKVEDEVQEVLRADDSLIRVYAGPDSMLSANLFVAFFRSQRYGQAPHSPKNCLPGSGWQPTSDGTQVIEVDGVPGGIEVNRYVIAKGEVKSLVYYWYQSHDRVIASEYLAKIYLVLDSIRYQKTDTSIVRVLVPLIAGQEKQAENSANAFVRAVYPELRKVLPN
jgi:EpsI family protein